MNDMMQDALGGLRWGLRHCTATVMCSCQVSCGGPWGSALNGAVVVLTMAVPGRTARQVVCVAPSSAVSEVQRTTELSVLVKGPHGWCGDGSVWIRRAAPGVRQSGVGCSPRRAVIVAALVQPLEVGLGRPVSDGGTGWAVAAGEAEPAPSAGAAVEPAAQAVSRSTEAGRTNSGCRIGRPPDASSLLRLV